MASSAAVSDVQPSSVVKVPLGSLLVVCVVAVVLAVGGSAGVLLYLSKHGKLVSTVQLQPAVPETAKEATPTHNVMLEPILVNLADADGHSYLRLGVVLAEELEKDAKPKEDKPAPGGDAAVRDAVLGVLGKKHAAELLEPEGKDALKKEVREALEARVPTAKVRAVYFTDFLVQR
ncbi:MAG: flagellar basal body-associated FliL family protein [Acidobacteriaceae bacterium]|nr:flagellar basal body-associated FliL family protein [Acidobacteriaceae bacterium]